MSKEGRTIKFHSDEFSIESFTTGSVAAFLRFTIDLWISGVFWGNVWERMLCAWRDKYLQVLCMSENLCFEGKKESFRIVKYLACPLLSWSQGFKKFIFVFSSYTQKDLRKQKKSNRLKLIKGLQESGSSHLQLPKAYSITLISSLFLLHLFFLLFYYF